MSDAPKVFKEKKVKARKRHRCVECEKFIESGDMYFRVEGIWDVPMTFKTCVSCDELRTKFLRESDMRPEELCYGELYECLEMER